jgi:hypothetical protein
MKGSIRLLRVSLCVIILGFTAFGQAEWIGAYEFEEDGGKTAGGTAIFIRHDLEIIKADEGFIAYLKSNGFQTSIDIVCTAKTVGGKRSLYFESYGEDNVFEPYEKGELLLTLEIIKTKGKNELVTNWGEFKPVVPKNEKSGKVYFKKVENPSL